MLRKELIILKLTGETNEEVLRNFGQKFVELGVVKESFPDALVERERQYPTALPATAFDIAVPHTFKEHVNVPAMGVAVLEHPVAFQQMGTPEITLHPQVLFMLAVKEPSQQIVTLKKILKLIQNEDVLMKIKNASSEDELFELVNSVLD